MALTVLSVAFPLAPVSPDAVGGAEQILSMLDEAIVASGHRSIVVACAGSVCAGELVPLPAFDARPIAESVWQAQHQACREALSSTLRRERVDVVHAHGVDFDRYVGGVDVPLLVTAHLPPAWYRRGAFAARRPELVAFVSASQRDAAGSLPCPSVVVRNGVRLDRFRFERRKGPSVVALGRISPEKGFHVAIEACRAAGVPLTIAGKLFEHPAHAAYFESEIRPRLDAERRFVGPVDCQTRRELLAGARCLLVTSLAPETSCLVAMEAMASGTPVVALRVGALREMVADGETGLLVDRIEDLPEAIARVQEIDPGACRRAAEARFDAGPMWRRYLELYRGLAGRPARSSVRLDRDVTVVTRPDRLRELEPEWRALWREHPDATPFNHPAWLLAAAEVFPPDALACVVSREGGSLQGIAPLGITGHELHHIGRALSDYLDAVVAPDAAESFGRSLAHTLARVDGWDHATFADLPETSVLRHAPPFTGCTEQIVPGNVCPVLDLTQPGGVPDRRAKELAQERRRCARRGLEIRRARDLAEAHRTFDDLVRLHEARWRARGQPGMLSDARIQRFHHLALDGLHAEGIARLYRLEARDRCLAVLYALVGDRRVCFYLSGFDPEVRVLGPGTLLVGRALDDARAEGKRFFDFLRGRESYKYAWGACDRVTWLRIVERGPREEAVGSWRSSECGGPSVT